MQNTLNLTLQKKWFDMIARGEKKEEYREIKPYWEARLENRQYDRVVFRNGYSPDSPTIEVECLGIERKNANPEWCGGNDPYCYAIKLGSIISQS